MTNIDKVLKDRLDFGFDSIYFRYAEAIIELSFYKEREAIKAGKTYFDRENWVRTKCQHFWDCLEQLTNAHSTPEETTDIAISGLKAKEAFKLFREFAATAQEATGGF